jgi:DNA (cytosine-5)-methyltransferase 1
VIPCIHSAVPATFTRPSRIVFNSADVVITNMYYTVTDCQLGGAMLYPPMRVLDLFSGIGGFSLGLERAGLHTVAFCETDPYCRHVLARHWPAIPCYDDVRTLTAERLRADGIAADVICGGFPCQDISVAGKGSGIAGERSGLWSEYARIIGELRPRYAIVENVSALLGRGLARILGDLSEIGYDAEWQIISAADIGAPHRRERVWIVAYPDGSRQSWTRRRVQEDGYTSRRADACNGSEVVADADGGKQHGRGGSLQMGWGAVACKIANDGELGRTQWSSEPDVGRVAHGVPSRVDRLRALGNAVVPQITEIIGRAIMTAVSENADG